MGHPVCTTTTGLNDYEGDGEIAGKLAIAAYALLKFSFEKMEEVQASTNLCKNITKIIFQVDLWNWLWSFF